MKRQSAGNFMAIHDTSFGGLELCADGNEPFRFSKSLHNYLEREDFSAEIDRSQGFGLPQPPEGCDDRDPQHLKRAKETITGLFGIDQAYPLITRQPIAHVVARIDPPSSW